MVLYSKAQYLEAVHPDARVLGPLLAFKDHVHRAGEEADESISLAGSQEYFAQFQPQHLAHCIERRLELRGRIPLAVLAGIFLALGLSSSPRRNCTRRFLGCLHLNGCNRPLEKKAIDL